jgi:hypothetical protein
VGRRLTLDVVVSGRHGFDDPDHRSGHHLADRSGQRGQEPGELGTTG